MRKRKHIVSAHAHVHTHRLPDSREETRLNPHQTQERNITDLRRGKEEKKKAGYDGLICNLLNPNTDKR